MLQMSEKRVANFSRKPENKIFGINKDFEFDFSQDSVDDLMYLTKNLYKTKKFKSVYWFGYKFNDHVDSSTRTQLIKFLRGMSEREFRSGDRRIFVENPLAALEEEASIRDVDCIIYPDSKRSDLNSYQVEIAGKYFRNGAVVPIRLVKEESKKVDFDYDRFFEKNKRRYPTDKFKKQAVIAIKEMMNKIHNTEYFSIAEIKTKYRNFMTGYLIFDDPKIDLTQYNKAIIFDDIVTSGATVDYTISLCKNLNPHLKLYIYSIIGRE